jgi:Tfp pilus assembly PilM family ATPase
MAVRCPAAAADGYLDLVEGEALNVVGLDTPTSAAARACLPLAAAAPALTAILDIGWRATVLVILNRGVVAYERAIADAGLRRLLADMAGVTDGDAEAARYLAWDVGFLTESATGEAFGADGRDVLREHFTRVVGELRMAFQYIVRQSADAAVDTLLLIGGGAAIPGIAAHLREVLAVQVRPVAGSELVAFPPAMSGRLGPDAVLAVGLALFAGG